MFKNLIDNEIRTCTILSIYNFILFKFTPFVLIYLQVFIDQHENMRKEFTPFYWGLSIISVYRIGYLDSKPISLSLTEKLTYYI